MEDRERGRAKHERKSPSVVMPSSYTVDPSMMLPEPLLYDVLLGKLNLYEENRKEKERTEEEEAVRERGGGGGGGVR